MDGLDERLDEYYELGARFAKWRAVISISDDLPSKNCIKTECPCIGKICRTLSASTIVPIVEPEVLMDGTHDIDRCFDVTSEVLQEVFAELNNQQVALNGIVLKPNMVISGMDAANRADIPTVAVQP